MKSHFDSKPPKGYKGATNVAEISDFISGKHIGSASIKDGKVVFKPIVETKDASTNAVGAPVCSYYVVKSERDKAKSPVQEPDSGVEFKKKEAPR